LERGFAAWVDFLLSYGWSCAGVEHGMPPAARWLARFATARASAKANAKQKQVLRLRYAPLRMTGCFVLRSAPHEQNC
jgi:hypothetical protein